MTIWRRQSTERSPARNELFEAQIYRLTTISQATFIPRLQLQGQAVDLKVDLWHRRKKKRRAMSMKRVCILSIGLWVSQLQADVVSELSLCDALVEPAKRLQCFNKVASRHAAPPTVRGTSSGQQETTVQNQTSEIVGRAQNKDVDEASDSMPIPPSTKRPVVVPRVTVKVANIDTPVEDVLQRAERPNPVAAAKPQATRSDWDKPIESAAREMHATILAVRKLPAGQFLLTFDDGQVWREIEPRRRSRYSIEDGVIVSSGFGGSFNIKSKVTGYRNKVRRVK